MIRPSLKFNRAISIVAAIAFTAICAAGQPPNASATPRTEDNKAEAVVNRTLEAIGGSSFLNVQTVIGRGFYTTYQDGAPLLPTRFVDYIAFPDKERTEFT